MIKTCQVITSINIDTGGPAVSVTRLAQELATIGFDSHLVTLNYPSLGPQLRPEGATVHSITTGKLTEPLRGKSSHMLRTLERMAPELDCIHNHGLWMFPNWYARRVARKYNLPLIISPRGMLDEWSMHRSRLRKFLAWHLFEKKSMTTASLIHATSEAEAESIRKLGFTQPIAVIPNGVDLPDLNQIRQQPTLVDLFPQFAGKKCILFLSRIHPKKGLKALVKSWSKLHQIFTDWNVIISGPDTEGYRAEIESLASSLDVANSIFFTGPVAGEVKSALLSGAELMVLPTHSENFGIVIAEALAHSLPVITTHAAPWAELETENCGWWIEDSEDALTQALTTAIYTPQHERRQMGERGRALVRRKYSWESVGQKMHATYLWILNKAPTNTPPVWIKNLCDHDAASPEKLRITIAAGPMFPVPAVLGGAIPKIWQGLAEAFAAKGHAVTIIARAHENQPSRETINGVHYLRWGGYNQSSHIYYDLLRDLIYALRLRSRLPAADILVSNDFWLPIFTAKEKYWGKVVVNCGRFPKNQYHLYRHTACLAAVSTAVAEAIARQTPEVADIIRVLPNPVHASSSKRSLVKSLPSSKRILFVGRLHPEKGIHLLIRALRQVLSTHPEASLQLIGPYRAEEGGGGERYLRQLKIEAEKLPVEFAGPIYDSTALRDAYHQADLFCYPSLAEEGEAFGVAPLEAMASGLVPVVSKLACFSDFIFDGLNGFEFDHRSPTPEVNLSSALTKALDNPERLHQMELEAVSTALKYDYTNVAESYLSVFNDLLSQASTQIAGK